MTAAAIAWLGERNRAEALWLLPVMIVAAFLFLLAQALGIFFGVSPWSMLSPYVFKALRVVPLLLVAAFAYQTVLAIRESPRAPVTALLARLYRLVSDPWLVAARFAPLLLMPVVFVGFSTLKMLMPRFIPFYLDDTFAAMDRILFFGHQPWEFTHALFGSLRATLFLDFFYRFWVLLLSFAIGGFALFAPRQERARFFLSFTLAWFLLGFVAAWILASAGPCYSALVGAASAPEFNGLIQRLAHLTTVSDGAMNAPEWQQVLWRAHSSENYSFAMGISAMPSLHNAIAVLYALAAFRMSRLVGWFVAAFALIIFIGSIHVGWHYAVDGIVGGIAMYAIWRWVDRWCVRSGYDAAVTSGQGIEPVAAVR